MFRFALLAVALAACSENNFEPLNTGVNGAGAKIQVTPNVLDFGMLADGASLTKTFTVANVGSASLTVDEVNIDGPGSFTLLTDVAETTLDPDDSFTVDVAFTPEGDTENDATANVLSDDPDSPSTPVVLTGWPSAPQLTMSPDPLDFGSTALSCPISADVTLMNTGLEQLEIDTIDFGTSDGEMTLTDANVLPLSLAPGASTVVTVNFTPTTLVDSTGTLTVTSTDPRGPLTAGQVGRGEYGATVTDSFDKPVDPPLDMMFVVDQSCSMDAHATSLANAFTGFIDQINSVTSDWRIGVATKDGGCFNSGWFDANTPGYEQIFSDAVAKGSDNVAGYNDTEKLFAVTDAALSEMNGGCNANFLRAGALLHIITVSDEPEQSGTIAQTWLNGWTGYVADPALIKVSVIDDPTGSCGSGGDGGYRQMATLTGGLQLNVCTANWSSYTSDLAEASVAAADVYALSQAGDGASITITVNGVAVASGWHYDASTNSVVFDTPVADGAHIEITYGALICD
jgi:hypothetical protein